MPHDITSFLDTTPFKLLIGEDKLLLDSKALLIQTELKTH